MAQLPLTLAVTHDYVDLFAATVPERNWDNPPASLAVYHAAFGDVLKTCDELGARDDLPRLLHDLLEQGMQAGLAEKQVTVLAEHLDR